MWVSRFHFAKNRIFCTLLFSGLALALSGCDIAGIRKSDKKPAYKEPPSVPRSVLITWAANREAAVNRAGGGYIVYYSTSSFGSTAPDSVNVPYVSGATAPTSATLPALSSKTTYYVRVVPYSALNAAGQPSSLVTVSIP